MATPIEQINPNDATVADVDLKKSYVTGGGGYFGLSRSLPSATDDLLNCIGPEVYEQMRNDADVEAAINTYKILVLSEPLQISSCVAKKDEKNKEEYEIAKANADFLNRSIAGLATPITQIFWEMLDAIPLGNKIAEITLKDGTGVDRGMLVLDSIKPKPYNVISFVVDLFWNLIGFLPTWGVTNESRKVLPRSKFLVLTLNSRNCDPRGRSWIRAAWRAYDFKERLWQIYYKWLHQFAVPSLIGKTGPNERGQAVTNADGSVTQVTAEEAMRDGLEGWENSTVVVVKNGADVEPVEVSGGGQQFERGFSISSKEISKAILFNELSNRDATHQTKAAGESQSDIVDSNAAFIRSALVSAFISDVAKPLIAINKGEVALSYMPHISLGDSERKHWATEADAGTKIITATRIDENGDTVPVLTYTQVQDILRMLSVKPPTDEEIKEIRARADERRQQKQSDPNKQNQPDNQNGSNGQTQQEDKKAA